MKFVNDEELRLILAEELNEDYTPSENEEYEVETSLDELMEEHEYLEVYNPFTQEMGGI